jgi:dynein heavy chain
MFEVEISKNYNQELWHEDMKRLLTTAGVDGKNIVFLLSDAHLK